MGAHRPGAPVEAKEGHNTCQGARSSDFKLSERKNP